MVGDILQPTHLIFILVVALLVLGPKRLPEVGRSLGKGIRDFRGAMAGIEEEVHDVLGHETEPLTPPPVTDDTVLATTAAAPEPVLAAPTTVPEPALATTAAAPEFDSTRADAPTTAPVSEPVIATTAAPEFDASPADPRPTAAS